jgi:ribosomal protein L37AE/L43A
MNPPKPQPRKCDKCQRKTTELKETAPQTWLCSICAMLSGVFSGRIEIIEDDGDPS